MQAHQAHPYGIFTAKLAAACFLVMPAARHFFARAKKVPKKHAKGKGAY